MHLNYTVGPQIVHEPLPVFHRHGLPTHSCFFPDDLFSNIVCDIERRMDMGCGHFNGAPAMSIPPRPSRIHLDNFVAWRRGRAFPSPQKLCGPQMPSDHFYISWRFVNISTQVLDQRVVPSPAKALDSPLWKLVRALTVVDVSRLDIVHAFITVIRIPQLWRAFRNSGDQVMHKSIHPKYLCEFKQGQHMLLHYDGKKHQWVNRIQQRMCTAFPRCHLKSASWRRAYSIYEDQRHDFNVRSWSNLTSSWSRVVRGYCNVKARRNICMSSLCYIGTRPASLF